MIAFNLIWKEPPGEGLPPLGRTVLVHCPSDPEKVNLAFYSQDGSWYEVLQTCRMRYQVKHWAEIPLPN